MFWENDIKWTAKSIQKVQAKSRYSLSSLPFITTRICKTILATKQTHQAVMAQPLTQALQPQKRPARSNAKVLGRLGNWKLSSAHCWRNSKQQLMMEATNQGLVKYCEHGTEIMHVVVPSQLSKKKSGYKFGTKMPGRQFAFLQIVSRDVISDPSLTSISVASDKASKSSLSKSPSKVALAAAALSSSCVTSTCLWYNRITLQLATRSPFQHPNKASQMADLNIFYSSQVQRCMILKWERMPRSILMRGSSRIVTKVIHFASKRSSQIPPICHGNRPTFLQW